MKKIPFFFLFFLLILPLGYSYLSVESDIENIHVCSYEEFNIKVRNTGTDAVYNLVIKSNNPYINFKSINFDLKSQETYEIPVKLNVECANFENVNKTNLTLIFKNLNINYEEKYQVEVNLLTQDVLNLKDSDYDYDDGFYYFTYKLDNNNLYKDEYEMDFIYNIPSNYTLDKSYVDVLKYLLSDSNSNLLFQINSTSSSNIYEYKFEDIINNQVLNNKDKLIINANESFTIKSQIKKSDLLLLNTLGIVYYLKITSLNYGDYEYLFPFNLDEELNEKLKIINNDVELEFNDTNFQNYLFNSDSTILLNKNATSEYRCVKVLENNKTKKSYRLLYPNDFFDVSNNESLMIKYSKSFNSTIFTRYSLSDSNLVIEEYKLNAIVPNKLSLRYLIYQILLFIFIIIVFIFLIFLIIKNRKNIKNNYNKLAEKVRKKNKKRIDKKARKVKEKLEKKSFQITKKAKGVFSVDDNSNYILEEKVKKSLEEGYSSAKIDDNVKKEKFIKNFKKKIKSKFKKLKSIVKVFLKKTKDVIKRIFLFIKKIFWIIVLILFIVISVYLVMDYNSFNNEKVLEYYDNVTIDSLRDFHYYAQNLTTYFRNDTFFTNAAFMSLLYEKTELIDDKIIIGYKLRFDKDKYFLDPDKEGLELVYIIDYLIPINSKYTKKLSFEDLEIYEEDKFFKDSGEGVYKLRAKVYDQYNESAESEYFYYFNFKSKIRYDFFTYLKYRFFN